jgi:hypothetical protein
VCLPKTLSGMTRGWAWTVMKRPMVAFLIQYWRWKSRHVGGRPRIDSEMRARIRRMSRENPLWGAPRILGELLMLGIEVAESTVGRYMVRRRRPPSQAWKTSCAIMAPASLRWIYSSYARSRSSYSKAW